MSDKGGGPCGVSPACGFVSVFRIDELSKPSGACRIGENRESSYREIREAIYSRERANGLEVWTIDRSCT